MALQADSSSPGGLGDLWIRELRIGHRTVLAASGEIDVATVDELRAALARAAESGALDLWLDLTRITFMDSSGTHAILDAREDAEARKRRFVVICPEGPVLRVMRIAGVVGTLPIYADRASAHAAS